MDGPVFTLPYSTPARGKPTSTVSDRRSRVLGCCILCIFTFYKLAQYRIVHTDPSPVTANVDGSDEFCGEELELFHSWSGSSRLNNAPLGFDALESGDAVLAHDSDKELEGLLEKVEDPPKRGLRAPPSSDGAAAHVDAKVNGAKTLSSAQIMSEQNVIMPNTSSRSVPNVSTPPATVPMEAVTRNASSFASDLSHLREEMAENMTKRAAARRALDDRVSRHIARLHMTVAAAAASTNLTSVKSDVPAEHHMNQWAEGMVELQQKLERQSQALRDTHERNAQAAHERELRSDAKHAAHVSDDVAAHTVNPSSHVAPALQLAGEMDHWNAVRTEAATLAASLATLDGAHGHEWDGMTSMAQELVHLQAELERKLRERDAEHHVFAAGALSSPGASLPTPPAKRLRGQVGKTLRGTPAPASSTKDAHHLEWARVPAWKTAPLDGNDAIVVSRKALHFAKWEGKVPKVSCIAVVPPGRRGEALMKYFVDNFKLQHYEGEKELILIYHEDDHATNRLVKKYEDGVTIRSGTVSDHALPSAVAFRYGAWMASGGGADVIARWDFGGWYHPARIATQVQALAYSGRPACVLGSWTVSDGTNDHHRTASAGHLFDATLVGEAAWMRKHWYPNFDETGAKEENSVLEAKHLPARQLALLEHAPELAVYNSDAEVRVAPVGAHNDD